MPSVQPVTLSGLLLLLAHVGQHLASAAPVGPCAVLPNVTAFFVDLDGTMYHPGGLIDGAKQFVSWLEATGRQFVFLSNSGASLST